MSSSLPPSRRSLLAACSVLGGGAVLTACATSSRPTEPTEGQRAEAIPEAVGAGSTVMAASELPIGSQHSVKITDQATGSEPTVLLYRSSQEEVLAYSNQCPHQGCAVNPAPETEEFHCPCHGSRFAPLEGTVLAGPARTGLKRYATAIEDGNILVFLGS